MSRPLVYVAGPIGTYGDQVKNVRKGARVALELMRHDVDAFCPHMSWFANLFDEETPTYERWLSFDFNVLCRCNAVLRIDGPSPGADREVIYAQGLGIPVFYSIQDLLAGMRKEVGDAR